MICVSSLAASSTLDVLACEHQVEIETDDNSYTHLCALSHLFAKKNPFHVSKDRNGRLSNHARYTWFHIGIHYGRSNVVPHDGGDEWKYCAMQDSNIVAWTTFCTLLLHH